MAYHIRSRLVPLAGVVLALASGGCRLISEQDSADPGPAYPESVDRGRTADIQVFRDVVTLRLTNSTAETLGPGRIWLNQTYSAPAQAFAPGDTLELDLRSFVDEFGEVFRAGGFFAQRDPADVVLVEFETGDAEARELVALIVVENKID